MIPELQILRVYDIVVMHVFDCDKELDGLRQKWGCEPRQLDIVDGVLFYYV
jgi:hypothetical protein